MITQQQRERLGLIFGGAVLAIGLLWHQHNVTDYKKCEARFRTVMALYKAYAPSPCVKSWP